MKENYPQRAWSRDGRPENCGYCWEMIGALAIKTRRCDHVLTQARKTKKIQSAQTTTSGKQHHMAGLSADALWKAAELFPNNPVTSSRADAQVLFGRWIYEQRRWSELSVEDLARECERTEEWVIDLQNGKVMPTKYAFIRLSLALEGTSDVGSRPIDQLVELNIDPWSDEAQRLRAATGVVQVLPWEATATEAQNDGKSPLAFFYGVDLRDKLLTFGPLVILATVIGSLFTEHPWSNKALSFDKVEMSTLTFFAIGILAFLALAVHPLAKCLDAAVRVNRAMPWNLRIRRRHNSVRKLRDLEHLIPRPTSIASTVEKSSSANPKAEIMPVRRTGSAWYDADKGWYAEEDEPYLIQSKIKSYRTKAIEADMTERMALVSLLSTTICVVGVHFAMNQTHRPIATMMERMIHHLLLPTFSFGALEQLYWWLFAAVCFATTTIYFHRRTRKLSKVVYTKLWKGYASNPRKP